MLRRHRWGGAHIALAGRHQELETAIACCAAEHHADGGYQRRRSARIVKRQRMATQ